jgi:hypothetical protein
MTPTTATATPVDIAAIVARLKAKQAALGDVPNTPHAQATFYEKQTTIARTISVLINVSDLERAVARLANAKAQHAALLASQSEIERQIAEAPDWRTIRRARDRDREWGRHQDLFASRKAIIDGVEYMNGWPCVPNTLKQMLGAAIEADGREMPNWYGSLSEVEQRIADLTKRVASVRLRVDAAVAQAEALLSEAVTP